MHDSEPEVNRQLETDSIPDCLWDVVIAGAGPAGAMAACRLAERNHRVLLLDRKIFPREKVCGDGLLPNALRCLDAIGVGETIRAAGYTASTGIVFSPSLHRVEIPGEYLTIKRSTLDMIVAARAVDLGATFAIGEVERLSLEPDGLVSLAIQGHPEPVRSRIGVVATGVDLRLMHKMDWPARKRPSGIAMRCYVRSSLVIDRLVIHFAAHSRFSVPGYGWIFPMRDQIFNVGFGILNLKRVRNRRINLKRKFEEFTGTFPLAKELMQKSDQTTAPGAAALRYDFDGAHPFVRGPIVAVGETIGTTLPFIGEGIGKALESGQMAAGAISQALLANDLSRLSAYSKQIKFEFQSRYRGYRRADKWVARPRSLDYLVNRSGKSKYAQEILAGIINETKNPHDIFSLKGILKITLR